MIFNTNEISYAKYDIEKQTVCRNFEIKREVIEKVNEVIAVYNKKNKNIKINSSIFGNIAFNYFFNELEKYNDDAEKINFITDRIINECKNLKV